MQDCFAYPTVNISEETLKKLFYIKMASTKLMFFTCCLLLSVAVPLVNARGIHGKSDQQAEVNNKVVDDAENVMGRISDDAENETVEAAAVPVTEISKHSVHQPEHKEAIDDGGDLLDADEAFSDNDKNASKSGTILEGNSNQHSVELSRSTRAINPVIDEEPNPKTIYDDNNDNNTTSSQNLFRQEVDHPDKQLPGSTINNKDEELRRSDVNEGDEDCFEDLSRKQKGKENAHGTSSVDPSVDNVAGVPDGSLNQDKEHREGRPFNRGHDDLPKPIEPEHTRPKQSFD